VGPKKFEKIRLVFGALREVASSVFFFSPHPKKKKKKKKEKDKKKKRETRNEKKVHQAALANQDPGYLRTKYLRISSKRTRQKPQGMG